MNFALEWLPIDTAPKDGSAFLAYGRHTDSPESAQRGVKAGDHWWAIILWDVWREPAWVFAKDGTSTWSQPTHWLPLPAPPESGCSAAEEEFYLRDEVTWEGNRQPEWE